MSAKKRATRAFRAFDKGRAARLRGLPISACPYRGSFRRVFYVAPFRKHSPGQSLRRMEIGRDSASPIHNLTRVRFDHDGVVYQKTDNKWNSRKHWRTGRLDGRK